MYAPKTEAYKVAPAAAEAEAVALASLLYLILALLMVSEQLRTGVQVPPAAELMNAGVSTALAPTVIAASDIIEAVYNEDG